MTRFNWGVSIPAVRVRYIGNPNGKPEGNANRSNSRSAGKIHSPIRLSNKRKYDVSIPAVRVRYIMMTFPLNPVRWCFNSRSAGKIH